MLPVRTGALRFFAAIAILLIWGWSAEAHAQRLHGTVQSGETANDGNNTVVQLGPDGKMLGTPYSGGGIEAPLGVAVDSLGNVWVANSGLVPLPCAPPSSVPAAQLVSRTTPSVTEISPSGDTFTLSNFTGGGLTVPWGIAVDGNDNISSPISAASGCPSSVERGPKIVPRA
jgi:hypothetical protein